MGNVLQKLPYPATSAGSPGSPGSPAIAGYYSYAPAPLSNPNTTPQYTRWIEVPPNPIVGRYQTTYILQVSSTPLSTGQSQLPAPQVAIWHPPQPAVAPVAAVAPTYPPNAWDGGAVSIASLANDGDCVFSVDAGASGVMVGLAVGISVDPKNIQHGLYFHSNLVQPVENGAAVSGATGYLPTDVWTIRRRLDVVTLLKNGAAYYTSATASSGVRELQASLYAPYDTVRNAALTPYASGSVLGLQRYMSGRMGRVLAYAQGSFQLLAATVSATGHGTVGGQFRYLDAMLGKRVQAKIAGQFQYLSAILGSGALAPAAPSQVVGSFNYLQANLHGLTGGMGQVPGSFQHMDAMLGKKPQGRIQGSFVQMGGLAYQNPPGTVFVDAYATADLPINATAYLFVNADSTGTATSAFVVDVQAYGAVDSKATASVAWVLSQVDSVLLNSTAVAHDLMASGVALGGLPPGLSVWVLNVDTNASTRYESFNYSSLTSRGGRLFGAKADGVYLLEGADDAGTQIKASFATGVTNFTSEKDPAMAGALKRVVAAYLGVAADKTMYLKISSGGQDFMYRARTQNPALMQQRVDPGRGLRSTYYAFEVYNSEGSDFDLESLEFVPIKLPRRIG